MTVSTLTPPEVVRGEAAKHPPRKRKTRREPMFLLNAQPTWKPV